MPPLLPILHPGEIHLWIGRLRDSRWAGDFLCAHERQRADAALSEKRKRELTAGRSQLRWLLGLYFDHDPRAVEIRADSRGRIYCPADPSFDFNLSHSEDLAVYAFARGGRVGVDVECRKEVDFELLGNRVFSAPEKRRFDALVGIEKRNYFFQIWTQKEAFTKLEGRGLGMEFPSVDIASTADRSLWTWLVENHQIALAAEGATPHTVVWAGTCL